MVEGGDDAHADHIVGQGDVPEPADLAGRLHHQRAPGIAALLPPRTLEVRPDRGLLEDGIPLPQAQPVENHAALAGRVDDHLAPRHALVPCIVDGPHADGTLSGEQHLEHANPLMHVDAVPAGIVEQQLVEILPRHLPGARTLVLFVI